MTFVIETTELIALFATSVTLMSELESEELAASFTTLLSLLLCDADAEVCVAEDAVVAAVLSAAAAVCVFADEAT